MKRHYVHLGELNFAIAVEQVVKLSDQEASHCRVLRLKNGEKVNWLSFNGFFGEGEYNNGKLIISSVFQNGETNTVYIGVPDKQAQKESIESALINGFGKIFFVNTSRSDTHKVNIPKLYLNAASVQKQCGYNGAVEIKEIEFSEVPLGECLCFDPTGHDVLEFCSLRESSQKLRLKCFIGPPGGIDENELSAFPFKVALPGHILRTPIAVLVATYTFNLLLNKKS